MAIVAMCASMIALGILTACQADKSVREATAKAILLPGQGITVFAAGDIANCRKLRPEDSNAAKTATLVANGLAKDPEAVVLTLGDHTYPVGLLSEFTDCYDPTWGQFKARTYPSPGNHEYYTPHAIGYFRYFGNAASTERPGYYSFNLGKWHIVSLNSYLKPEQHAAQLEWLKADLARNQTRCALAFWHHPRYSSGGHGNNPQIDDAWQILYAAGVELLLSAHDHNYERFAPQDGSGQHDEKRGIRQFVVGTGGASLTPLRFRKPHSEVSDNSTYGVLKLVLKDIGYEWEFLPVKKDGFRDSGAALCH
ncbi:metallophosphoesterase family protein [Noviherbaspirillum agri]